MAAGWEKDYELSEIFLRDDGGLMKEVRKTESS